MNGGTRVAEALMPSRESRWASGTITGLSGALLGAGAATITVPYLRAAATGCEAHQLSPRLCQR